MLCPHFTARSHSRVMPPSHRKSGAEGSTLVLGDAQHRHCSASRRWIKVRAELGDAMLSGRCVHCWGRQSLLGAVQVAPSPGQDAPLLQPDKLL